MPKNNNSYNFDIEYCNSWGGRPEASFAYKLLKTVYLKGVYNVNSPGYTGNLIIRINKIEVFNKMAGDGDLQSDTSVPFLKRV
jgi:hypothetical protein